MILIAEFVLFFGIGIVAPLRLPTGFIAFLLFTVAAAILWTVLAFSAMWFDYATGNDIPGAGYFALGMMSWIIGVVVLGIRKAVRSRRKAIRASN